MWFKKNKAKAGEGWHKNDSFRISTIVVFVVCLFVFNTWGACRERDQGTGTVIRDTFNLSAGQPVHLVKLENVIFNDPPEAIQIRQSAADHQQKYYVVKVYLTDSRTDIFMGNFTAYPANSAGSYLMRFDKPFQELRSASPDHKTGSEIELKFVLERKDKKADIRVEITEIKIIQKIK